MNNACKVRYANHDFFTNNNSTYIYLMLNNFAKGIIYNTFVLDKTKIL